VMQDTAGIEPHHVRSDRRVDELLSLPAAPAATLGEQFAV